VDQLRHERDLLSILNIPFIWTISSGDISLRRKIGKLTTKKNIKKRVSCTNKEREAQLKRLVHHSSD